MNERIQTPREQLNGSSPWNNLFDEPENAPGQVVVHSGPHTRSLPLDNMTVAEIRARFHDVLDIEDQSRAVLDGIDVDNDTVVRQGQVLMFTHRAGEKGLCNERTASPALTPPGKSQARSRRVEVRHRQSISRSVSRNPEAGRVPIGRLGTARAERRALPSLGTGAIHTHFPRWRPALHTGFHRSPAPSPPHES